MNFTNYGIPQQMPQMAQQMNQPLGPAMPTDDRIWVQSEMAAEAYLVSANSTVHLWDSAKPLIYIRKTDAAGRPFPMEVLEYKKREGLNAFSTDYIDEISELRQRIEALEQKGSKNAKTKSNADDATT